MLLVIDKSHTLQRFMVCDQRSHTGSWSMCFLTVHHKIYQYLSNEMQHKAVYLLFCKFILHVSGVNHTNHQEYTKL